jgi:hypothetical protein
MRQSSLCKRKKPTALSGRLAFFLRFYCRRNGVNPEGGRLTSSACALAKARKSKTQLARCRRAWTPKLPARRIFNCVDTLPRCHHDRVLAIGNPLHCDSPNAVQHIQASNYGSDGRKSNREERKHCQQFPHEIHLQRNQRRQEHPHPLSALILVLHLSSVAHPLPLKFLAANLCFSCCTFCSLT